MTTIKKHAALLIACLLYTLFAFTLNIVSRTEHVMSATCDSVQCEEQIISYRGFPYKLTLGRVQCSTNVSCTSVRDSSDPLPLYFALNLLVTMLPLAIYAGWRFLKVDTRHTRLIAFWGVASAISLWGGLMIANTTVSRVTHSQDGSGYAYLSGWPFGVKYVVGLGWECGFGDRRYSKLEYEEAMKQCAGKQISRMSIIEKPAAFYYNWIVWSGVVFAMLGTTFIAVRLLQKKS